VEVVHLVQMVLVVDQVVVQDKVMVDFQMVEQEILLQQHLYKDLQEEIIQVQVILEVGVVVLHKQEILIHSPQEEQVEMVQQI
tara:strand:+ start:181 stop:429 length:249 start_codon:yes stop_codon:yes gene_type:complete